MKPRLRFTEAAWRALCAYHRHDERRERASVAFARVERSARGQVLLVGAEDLLLFDDADYAARGGGAVRVTPETTRRVMWAFAQSGRAGFISIHDHWFSQQGTKFSELDDDDDRKQDRYLRDIFVPLLRTHPEWGRPREVTHAALVFDRCSLDARLVDSRRARLFESLHSVAAPSARLVSLAPNGAAPQRKAGASATPHARHSDFIAPDQQRMLARLTIGLIGCGGVGALIAENLARLGVGGLVLVDPDLLADTNLNRWPAAAPSQVGQAKAKLLCRRLQQQTPWVEVRAVAADALAPGVLPHLLDCDVLISAVDNDAARLWANRLALQYLLPLFDIGVMVQTQSVVDFAYRIVPVVPGVTACLECSGLAMLDRLEIAKSLDGATRAVRAQAGYVEGQDVAAPSVMGINSVAAGSLCLEVLSYLCGYQQRPAVKIARWRSARTTVVQPTEHLPGAHCVACADLLGRASEAPLPRRRTLAQAQAAFARLRRELAAKDRQPA
jgi:hypothetical protein